MSLRRTRLLTPELPEYAARKPQIGFGAIVTFVVCGSILLALFKH